MESSSLVKITGAFAAGVVVALGSALIAVRISDTRRAPMISQPPTVVAVPAATELPDAGSDTTPPQVAQSAAMPEPKPVVRERAKSIAPAKTTTTQHRLWTPATSVKPLHRPVLVAQNRVPTSAVMVPTPTPSVVQSAPPAVAEPDATPTTGDASNATSTAPPVAEPTPVPAAPQPHVVTLAAGTVLSVRLGETLSTDHNYTGDTFRATLLSPVIKDGFIIADKGSKVLGRIVNAQAAGHMASVAGLTLALTEINTTDGQRVAVTTDVYDRKGSSNVGPDTAKIAGGAALGAIIGAAAGGGKGAAIGAGAGGAAGAGAVMLTHGKPVVVQNETQLTFRLANPVTITEKLN